MSYFVGSFVTFFLIFATSVFLRYNDKVNKIPRIRSSQAYTFIVLKNLIAEATLPKHKKETQASKHDEKSNVRVILLEKHAYWVKDNSFYIADLDEDGIDGGSARIVDTMGMDKVQLDKMLFILDQLRDGKQDDSRDSGHK